MWTFQTWLVGVLGGVTLWQGQRWLGPSGDSLRHLYRWSALVALTTGVSPLGTALSGAVDCPWRPRWAED